MPWGLRRYQNSGTLHFITFSCYRRQPLLMKHGAAQMFEQALEEARVKYGFFIFGYVVMPEHTHLLVSEPERGTLATAIKALKQSVARRQVNLGGGLRSSQQKDPHKQKPLVWGTQHFWQKRYYDFNVCTPQKHVEKLKYIHRNPVHRGQVARPEDWPWSSYRHYAIGEVGTVQIESPVSAWKRRQVGKQNALTLPQE
jgi:putative transposase